MKLIALIPCLLFQLAALSQKDSIIIQGFVTSNYSKPVKRAMVHLVSSQGHRYEYITDSSGTYRFHFPFGNAFTCTVSIASDKYTSSGNFRNMGFLASKDTAVFIMQSGRVYKKDFILTEVPFCGPIAPSIGFYTQSLRSYNDSLYARDSVMNTDFENTIQILYTALKEEPGLVIRIEGHASSIEKNPEQLSLQRAEHIRDLLVAKGINSKRIAVKGWGTSKLLVTDTMIRKAKTKTEKFILHQKNQRVIYRIMSWDYKD